MTVKQKRSSETLALTLEERLMNMFLFVNIWSSKLLFLVLGHGSQWGMKPSLSIFSIHKMCIAAREKMVFYREKKYGLYLFIWKLEQPEWCHKTHDNVLMAVLTYQLNYRTQNNLMGNEWSANVMPYLIKVAEPGNTPRIVYLGKNSGSLISTSKTCWSGMLQC